MIESVLDLPQLWQKPSFDGLLLCLQSLEIQPKAWIRGTASKQDKMQTGRRMNSHQHSQEIAIYLSSIIKSPLMWLESDEEREVVWDEACKRISERSGRAAMRTMTRCWPFPDIGDGTLELSIREPAFTGDSLGHKTWGSSYLLALDLPRLASGVISDLFKAPTPPSVLELGSGTGLLGIAAAATWQTRVVLSDLPDIVPNLLCNAEANSAAVEALGGSLVTGVLTWGSEDEFDQDLFGTHHAYKIILAADSLYDDVQPDLLYHAISQHLSLDADVAVVVMAPQRDQATVGLTRKFRSLMASGERPLECVEEGELDQHDDWGHDDDDGDEECGGARTRCWWGVFRCK
ncbi:hypothetical protein BROUX41_001245 [Berkeleyomyces rouxiae]|uniref:uncharacterized protein n=1 Tax=Berkeleyomyces rouxiae TaxID=2035830 RepID=UPI003B806028